MRVRALGRARADFFREMKLVALHLALCLRLPAPIRRLPEPVRRAGPPRLGLLDGASSGLQDVKSTIDGITKDYRDDEYVPDGYAKAAHILFLAEAENEAERKAKALRRRIEAGELSFGDAALLFSACPTRDLNGSLGIFPSLSRLRDGTLRGDALPYDGKDTASFDEAVFSLAALNVIHQVNSQWGTHLVLVTARGGPPSTSDLMAQATELVGQAMGEKRDTSGGFGAASKRSRGAKRRRKR